MDIGLLAEIGEKYIVRLDGKKPIFRGHSMGPRNMVVKEDNTYIWVKCEHHTRAKYSETLTVPTQYWKLKKTRKIEDNVYDVTVVDVIAPGKRTKVLEVFLRSEEVSLEELLAVDT